MTVLAPAAWWQGVLVLTVVGFLIVRHVPEGTPPPPDELPLAAGLEPAIVPPGEVPR